MSNHLQPPFQDIVGEKSPVQKAIKLLWTLAELKPITFARSKESQSSTALILTHILGLLDSAGMINGSGYHSAAISLFRLIEDATDCFAAVSTDNNAALRWADNKLKASDAAKIWTGEEKIFDGSSLADYRKLLRTNLNYYSHCNPQLTHWNIYLESISKSKCVLELNTKKKVININGYYIDRYLCAHLLELIGIITNAYSEYLLSNSKMKKELQEYSIKIEKIIIEFLEFIKKDKIDISVAPEFNRVNQ